jgi:hypothetical protein
LIIIADIFTDMKFNKVSSVVLIVFAIALILLSSCVTQRYGCPNHL